MSDDTFTYKNKNLQDFIKALQGPIPHARVGILGDKNIRKDGKSNATIGKKHEFGEITEINGAMVKLPVRSFLRMPLNTRLFQELEASGMFNKAVINEVIEQKILTPWLTKIGIIGEGIVLDAFQTSGFGTWKPSNMKFKTVKQTLVESNQLRNSITSDVVE